METYDKSLEEKESEMAKHLKDFCHSHARTEAVVSSLKTKTEKIVEIMSPEYIFKPEEEKVPLSLDDFMQLTFFKENVKGKKKFTKKLTVRRYFIIYF